MAIMNPLILRLETNAPNEDLLSNSQLLDIFPHLTYAPNLAGKITLFFNRANQIEFNNDGMLYDLIADAVWTSGDNQISVSSIKIKEPCVLTMMLEMN